MKIKEIGIPFLSLLILFGCSNMNDTGRNADQGDSDTQPIHYETDKGQQERERPQTNENQGGYSHSDQRDTNAAEGQHEDFTDPYVNKTTAEIYDQISHFKEIKQAQVTAADDKIVVALMLNDYNEEDVRDKIVNNVRDIVPNKEIVIYTDDVHWNRIKNKRARLKSPDGHANGPSMDNK